MKRENLKKHGVGENNRKRETTDKQVRWKSTQNIGEECNLNGNYKKTEEINKELCQRMTLLLDHFSMESEYKEMNHLNKVEHRQRNHSTNAILHPYMSEKKKSHFVSTVELSKNPKEIFDLTKFTKKRDSNNIEQKEIDEKYEELSSSSFFSDSRYLDRTGQILINSLSHEEEKMNEDSSMFDYEKERKLSLMNECNELILTKNIENEVILKNKIQKKPTKCVIEKKDIQQPQQKPEKTKHEKLNSKKKESQKQMVDIENLHKLEKENKELKVKFETKLKEVITNYEEEKERNEKRLEEIYLKYRNSLNQLNTLENEKRKVEAQNQKLLEELRNQLNEKLNEDLIENYKEKLQQYILLTNEQEESLRDIKKKLRVATKTLDEKEKNNLKLTEEKRKLEEINITLNKDIVELQNHTEELKNIQEAMKEILLNKEMKIQYFISILNVIDERIMNEQKNSPSFLHQHTNGKIELNAIQNMNKKIMIKSIIYKIKELNKKIEHYEKVLLLHDTVRTTGSKKCSNVDTKMCVNSKKPIHGSSTNKITNENSFDFQNLELHESTNKFGEEENETGRNFFINLQNT